MNVKKNDKQKKTEQDLLGPGYSWDVSQDRMGPYKTIHLGQIIESH